MPPVHFFIEPDGISLERARTLDPDREWRDIWRGKECWIVQTFARLRRRGHAVTLGNHVPSAGLVVYHKEQHRLVSKRMPAGARPILVAVRADFRSADGADFEILQNGYFADDERRFFVPHWPQPGLVPRDSARGERVERIAYKGHFDNLLAELRSDTFRAQLARQGMRLALDGAEAFDVDEPMPASWNDYSDVDVVLALRPRGRRDPTHKPASKLYNAWLAGTPAILSDDCAYRQARRSELDYLEATTAQQALEALRRLKRNGELYRAMQENGRMRAAEFSVPALTKRWEELLFETIPRLAARHKPRQYTRIARGLRGLGRKLANLTSGVPRK